MSGIPAVLFSILLVGFSAGTETAFSAASRISALGRAREGSRNAARALSFMTRPDRYLTTTLVLTNVGTVLCSTLTAGMAAASPLPWMESAVAVATGLVILVAAEAVPKQLCFAYRDTVVDLAALPLSVLRILAYPLILASEAVTRLLVRSDLSSRFFESREEVRSYLHMEGDEAGRDADRVLALGSATAAEHMRTLDAHPSVTLETDPSVALQVLLESRARFLLVFEAGGRTLLGMIRASSLLRLGGRGLPEVTEGLPYFDGRALLGRVLYDLKRAGAGAGVVMGRSGQPEGIIDTDLIMETILGPAGTTPQTPLGTLRTVG
jgi:CBS domain containing-hemolysin-like protein